MKTKIFVITLIMMLFAVQGYAQRERHESRRGYRTEQSKGHSRQGVEKRQTRKFQTTPQRNATPNYQEQYKGMYRAPRQYYRSPPPVYYYRPAPVYRHHHNYYHHRYHCSFNDWYWYNWGGYANRFICHQYYRNRYFDSMLGYYIWGTMNAPTRLSIGNMTFMRYNNTLQIRIGNQYTNLDLYLNQNIVYKIGHTSVNVTVGNGYATICFYDEYGNQASYTM